jgi:predicted Zn-dependent protease
MKQSHNINIFASKKGYVYIPPGFVPIFAF